MLVVKVYVNERQIDEIHIQNVSNPNEDEGYFSFDNYEIVEPKVGDLTIKHQRRKGHRSLVIAALEVLIERNEDKDVL